MDYPSTWVSLLRSVANPSPTVIRSESILAKHKVDSTPPWKAHLSFIYFRQTSAENKDSNIIVLLLRNYI